MFPCCSSSGHQEQSSETSALANPSPKAAAGNPSLHPAGLLPPKTGFKTVTVLNVTEMNRLSLLFQTARRKSGSDGGTW